MASCTEITYVKESLVGDPLDVKMFEKTGWVLDEPQTKTADENVVHAYVYPSEMKVSDVISEASGQR
jgi:hypothetical protein